MTVLHFDYPIAYSPILAELRQLAEIKPYSSIDELEKTKEIIGYVHGLFTHDGNNTPSASDPLTILTEAKNGKSFRCVEYGTLAAGLFWAHGIPARTIGLKTRDVETRKYGAGHIVIEFWSNKFNKWVMSDVQAGIIPMDRQVPLSARELAQKVNGSANVTYAPVLNARYSGIGEYDDKPSYTVWIKEYLCFIDTPVRLTLGNEDKRLQQIAMLIPKDVTPPKMFQGMFEMNAIYTTRISDFYAKPGKQYFTFSA